MVADGLVVAAAGDVVGDDPAGPCGIGGVDVVADEQRDRGEPLHRRAEVPAHHLGELVGLAVEGQRHALDLLVVLQLDGEQPHHLDRRSRPCRRCRPPSGRR